MCLFGGLLLILPLLQGQRSSDDPEGQISGTVVSAQSGELLKGVLVLLNGTSSAQDTKSAEASTTTGFDGRFLFSNLSPGGYFLQFVKSGYEGRGLPSRRVTLSDPNAAAELNISLRRAAVVTGRVLDENGEPVSRQQVRAYRKFYRFGWWHLGGAESAETDDRGEYRIFGLQAGRYIVGVSPRPQTSQGQILFDYAGSYYPNALSLEGAAWLNVSWGDELIGIDFQLAAAPATVTGLVVDGETGAPCGRCNVSVVRSEGDLFERAGAARLAPNGWFAISGLGPGTYQIMAQSPEGGRFATQDVLMGDSDVEGFELVVTAGQSVSGAVVLEEQPSISQPHEEQPPRMVVRLWPRLPFRTRNYGGAPVSPENRSFEFETLPPGTYRIGLEPLPPGGYLKAVYLSGQKLPQPEIVVGAGAPLSGLVIQIGFDGGGVSGTVKSSRSASPEEEPQRGVVALIPNDSGNDYLTERYARIQPDGGFEITAAHPGSYTLYAVPNRGTFELWDPEVRQSLKRFAVELSLSPEKSVSVEAILIPEP